MASPMASPMASSMVYYRGETPPMGYHQEKTTPMGSAITFYQEKLSNPEIFGPGLWLHIHSKARRADTLEKMLLFAEDMKETADDIQCSECSNHAKKYIQEHPIEASFNIIEDGEYIGCFHWTWKFHNAVNARLRKPIVSWETAKALFGKNKHVCESGCGEKKQDPLALRLLGYSPLRN